MSGRPQPHRQRLRGLASALLAGLVWSWVALASSARAEPAKRELPDYDGRPPEAPDLGDVLLAIPRALLSPLYVVSEYVLRKPLGFLISEAERAQLPEALYELFVFGPDHQAGIVPTAFIDFGFKPSVGLFMFWNDAVFKGHDLSLHASTWGEDWLAASFSERVRLGSSGALGVHFSGTRRPDFAFYGLGPKSVQAARGRYGASILEAGADGEWAGSRVVRLQGALGARSVNFHSAAEEFRETLEARAAAGRYQLPPGYETGYTVLYNRLQLAFDSRPKPADGAASGVRLELNAEQDSDVRRAPGAGYLRYGAILGGFYDLNDRGRVVSLSFAALFADPLAHRPVPFTELAALGGTGLMRGFLPGRLLDRSATAATLQYRWPIWVWLDGSIQLSVGNVFGPHLTGLRPELLRFSGTIGVQSGSPDNSLEVLVGLGSETFEHGAQLSSLRIVVGTNRGF